MKVTTQTVIQIFPSKPGFLGYRGDVEGKGNIADREGGRGRSGGGVSKVVGLKWGEQSGGLIREGGSGKLGVRRKSKMGSTERI